MNRSKRMWVAISGFGSLLSLIYAFSTTRLWTCPPGHIPDTFRFRGANACEQAGVAIFNWTEILEKFAFGTGLTGLVVLAIALASWVRGGDDDA